MPILNARILKAQVLNVRVLNVRVLVGAAFAVSVLFPVTSAVAAATFGTGSGSGGQSGGSITAGVQFGAPPPAKGRSDSSGCTWMPAGQAQIFDALTVTEKTLNGVKYVLFYRSCPKSGQGFWVAQLGSSALGMNAANVLQQRLPKPTFGSAPPVDKGIVNVGMWLWTDPNRYRPVSVTAWVPTLTGIAWATTTATPVRLVLLSGEPGSSPMSCPGPGLQWLPQFGDNMASACMYTYRHSSEITPTKVFDVTWSIVWSIGWRSNVGTGGSLGEYTSSTNQAVVVAEIQTVVNN